MNAQREGRAGAPPLCARHRFLVVTLAVSALILCVLSMQVGNGSNDHGSAHPEMTTAERPSAGAPVSVAAGVRGDLVVEADPAMVAMACAMVFLAAAVAWQAAPRSYRVARFLRQVRPPRVFPYAPVVVGASPPDLHQLSISRT